MTHVCTCIISQRRNTHSSPTVLRARDRDEHVTSLKRPHVPMHFGTRSIVFWKYRLSFTLRFPPWLAHVYTPLLARGSDRFRSKSWRDPPWHRSVDFNDSTFAIKPRIGWNGLDNDNTRGETHERCLTSGSDNNSEDAASTTFSIRIRDRRSFRSGWSAVFPREISSIEINVSKEARSILATLNMRKRKEASVCLCAK